MATKSKQKKGRDGALSLLNVAIDGLNLAKEISSATPAKAVFGLVSVLLAMIKVRFFHSAEMYTRFTFVQDSMANEQDFVNLGLHCADICKALERGINEKKLDDLSQSLCEAINQLKTWVESAVHSLDGSLTPHMVAELSRRSEEGLPSRVGATRFPDLSIPEMIRT